MPAWIPAAVAGAASLLGGERSNRLSRREARTDRAWREKMRNTTYQATVADMRAAGMNPALAHSLGGTGTPGGVMAPQDDVLTPAVSSAMQMKRMQADLDLIKSQERKVETEEKLAYQELRTRKWRADYMLGIDVNRNRQPIMELTESEISRSLNEARRVGLLGDTLQPMADISKRLGEWLPVLLGLSRLSPGGALRSFTRKGRK